MEREQKYGKMFKLELTRGLDGLNIFSLHLKIIKKYLKQDWLFKKSALMKVAQSIL